MTRTCIIEAPTRAGPPFLASVFDPDGRRVATRSFTTLAGAQAFLQAFTQENAGVYGFGRGDHTVVATPLAL